MRLFIGIKTGCGEYLAALQDRMRKAGRGRFTHADNLHITVKFLGELPPSAVKGICEAITEAGGEPFKLEIGGARIFNRSGILSADVLGQTDKLAALNGRLETALEKRGYSREIRPFKAHITLARDFQPHGDLGGIPDGQRGFAVDEVILFESRRENGRLVYVPLFTHRLGGEG
jgi:2'-5' RNA ligase